MVQDKKSYVDCRVVPGGLLAMTLCVIYFRLRKNIIPKPRRAIVIGSGTIEIEIESTGTEYSGSRNS